MRRELTDDRRRLHKNTHNWSRIRYRKIITGRVDGHVGSGERARIVNLARTSPAPVLLAS